MLAVFNKYLGWSVVLLSLLTLSGFLILSDHLGGWANAILAFILLNLLPFIVTGVLGTRNPIEYPMTRIIALQISRFYVFVTTILIPLTADHDFFYISIIGIFVILASFYFKVHKELQLLIFNFIGALIVATFAITGVSGLIESY
ncbi:MAG: hypothetical protein NXI10_07470 [bacterium]|nr:hypothetical protein [bacterium]